MKTADLALDSYFDVVLDNGRAQAAQAIVDGETVGLEPRRLLLIEAGEAHEIRCTGGEPLRTVNLYVPPEY